MSEPEANEQDSRFVRYIGIQSVFVRNARNCGKIKEERNCAYVRMEELRCAVLHELSSFNENKDELGKLSETIEASVHNIQQNTLMVSQLMLYHIKITDFTGTVYNLLSAQVCSTFFKSQGRRFYFIQILRKNYDLFFFFFFAFFHIFISIVK